MKGNTMRSTLLLVTMSIITGLAMGYLLRARKSADRLKSCCPEKKDENKEAKAQQSPEIVSI
jgi:hypothetical protein